MSTYTHPVCDPSIIQQLYASDFIAKLREDDGDSAYVPTTTVYSAFDEIVEPQDGIAASAFINDARGVGVSNNFLQGICAGAPASGLYDHEGVLYNSAAWALVLDALTNDGPGSFERVGSASCQDIVAPGLSLDDVIETEVCDLFPDDIIDDFRMELLMQVRRRDSFLWRYSMS